MKMKRVFLWILTIVMLCGCLTAFAAEPKMADTVDYDSLPEPDNGQHYYLLLCQDTWADHQKLGNTDGIVLVTLDTRAHRIMLTSIIRDALVKRPDGVMGRINYIAKNYSPEDLCRVVSTHLGVKVEKYVIFNFSHIQNIIDYLGGVDITITSAEASYLTRYAISKTSTSPSVKGAGTYRFYGHASVIYMRIRKAGGGGDFMRTQRVRTVLSTLADQCRDITYDEARALVDIILSNSSRTNMSLGDMVNAMEQCLALRDCTIEELRIPQDGDYHHITYAGMSVQEIDWAASRAKMEDYLQNSFLVIDDDEE